MVSRIDTGSFPRVKSANISSNVAKARELGVIAVMDDNFAYYADGHYEQIVGTQQQEFFKAISGPGVNRAFSIAHAQLFSPELLVGTQYEKKTNIIENQIADQIQIESRAPPTQNNTLPLLVIGGLVLILLAR